MLGRAGLWHIPDPNLGMVGDSCQPRGQVLNRGAHQCQGHWHRAPNQCGLMVGVRSIIGSEWCRDGVMDGDRIGGIHPCWVANCTSWCGVPQLQVHNRLGKDGSGSGSPFSQHGHSDPKPQRRCALGSSLASEDHALLKIPHCAALARGCARSASWVLGSATCTFGSDWH